MWGVGHEYLLAFSCKRRHFCPSCHQKRVVEFGETKNLLDVLTQYEIFGFCRLGLNRLIFYRTKTWDIKTENQISTEWRFIEIIQELVKFHICYGYLRFLETSISLIRLQYLQKIRAQDIWFLLEVSESFTVIQDC